METRRPFRFRAYVVIAVSLSAPICWLNGAKAQQLPSALKWPVEADVVRVVQTKFERGGFMKEQVGRFAFERLASIVAIPIKESPIEFEQLNSLEVRPVPIGLLYLAGGSDRLGLSPGAYAVQLSRIGTEKWMVSFLDQDGKERGRHSARVEKTEPIDAPLAYVDHSVCYRFDHSLVCI